ncbi:MAG: 2'-5' RNA ligase [Planctomycetota bacterium]|jgi:2'-5' RNA ligase
MGKKNDLRCFVGIELPNPLVKRLSREIGFLQLAGASVRWTSKKNLHLSVRFIGDVRPEEMMDVQRAVAEAVEDVRPTRLIIKGMKALPEDKATPRIISAGVQGDIEPLNLLYNNLQRTLGLIGFRPERKGYRPHITVGRVRGDNEMVELKAKLVESDRNEYSHFNVTKIHLMMSDMTPEGPIYTPMQTFPLTAE